MPEQSSFPTTFKPLGTARVQSDGRNRDCPYERSSMSDPELKSTGKADLELVALVGVDLLV